MSYTELDLEMKELEWFKTQVVPAGVYPILRIDGRAFSKVTERLGFTKPYDEEFHGFMAETARQVMENLGGIYAYHQSDEISILFDSAWSLFDRRVEKILSVSASLAGAVFNRTLMASQVGAEALSSTTAEEYPHFDARLVCAVNIGRAFTYFNWRQFDAAKNCLNSWAHWTAIQKDGMSPTAAGKYFEGQTVPFKHEFLFKRGINFNDLPLWQRRGSGHYWEEYIKEGFNPQTNQTTQVQRWRMVGDHGLPTGSEYGSFLARVAKPKVKS